MTEQSMDGRVAIVTGAGGGLGRVYALELARAGAAVVVNDTGGSVDGSSSGTSPARAVVEEIEALGGRAVESGDSVATAEGGAAVVETAMSAFGRVDVVVNNAGILRDRSFAKLDLDDFMAVHDVHLRGAVHVTQPAFVQMKEQGYGRLVFVASNAGTFGNFGQAAYGSAKAGIIGLSNVLAIEGASSGIQSNVVCPIARTRMTEAIFAEGTAGPEHVAGLVRYLASEACAVNHQVFSAGAGRYSRVFTGLTRGWVSPDGTPASAEDVATHLEQILDTEQFSIPMSATDELTELAGLLQPSGA